MFLIAAALRHEPWERGALLARLGRSSNEACAGEGRREEFDASVATNVLCLAVRDGSLLPAVRKATDYFRGARAGPFNR